MVFIQSHLTSNKDVKKVVLFLCNKCVEKYFLTQLSSSNFKLFKLSPFRHINEAIQTVTHCYDVTLLAAFINLCWAHLENVTV